MVTVVVRVNIPADLWRVLRLDQEQIRELLERKLQVIVPGGTIDIGHWPKNEYAKGDMQ